MSENEKGIENESINDSGVLPEPLTVAAAHAFMYDPEPGSVQLEPGAGESADGEGGVAAAGETAGEIAGAAADAGDAGESEPEGEPEPITFSDNVGLGVDVVEIARMEALLERSPSFKTRVFTEAECTYCDSKSNPAAHYATRWAAREAVVKALGTGFSDGIGVRDVEVGRTNAGKPVALLSGRAAEVASELGVRDLSISLSYTHEQAVACAMAITEASVRATEKRIDPMEELARQFKETRGMLDEL